MTTVDKSLLGMRVRMIEGHRETIVKITRAGYVTEKNSLITPDCIKPSGRGYREIEAPAADAPAADEVATRAARRAAKRLERLARKAAAAAEAAEEVAPKTSGITRKETSTKPTAKPATTSAPRVAKEEKVARRPAAVSGPVSEPVRLKKVVKMTQALSEEVRDSIDAQLASIMKKTGYNFTFALVAAKYTDNSISVEIGLLPTAATAEDVLEYRSLYETTWDEAEGNEEEETEGNETEEEEEEDESLEEIETSIEEDIEAGIEAVTTATGIEESSAKKFVTAWYENADLIEDKLDTEFVPGVYAQNESGHEIIVLGYSVAKEKVAVFDVDACKIVGFTFGQMSKYSVSENEQEQEEDQDEDL